MIGYAIYSKEGKVYLPAGQSPAYWCPLVNKIENLSPRIFSKIGHAKNSIHQINSGSLKYDLEIHEVEIKRKRKVD